MPVMSGLLAAEKIRALESVQALISDYSIQQMQCWETGRNTSLQVLTIILASLFSLQALVKKSRNTSNDLLPAA